MRSPHNIRYTVFFIVFFVLTVFLSGCDSSDNMFGLTGLNIFHAMDEPENTYYVDANLGNDSWDGNSTNPWETFSKAQSVLLAGDTLYMAGNFNNISFNSSSPVGTADNWITYARWPGKSQPNFTYIIFELNRIPKNVYLKFDGIYVDPGYVVNASGLGVVYLDGANNVIFNNSYFEGEKVAGDILNQQVFAPYVFSNNRLVNAGGNVGSSYITFNNCTLKYGYNNLYMVENDADSPTEKVEYWTATNNDMSNTGNDLITMGGGGHHIISNNYFHDQNTYRLAFHWNGTATGDWSSKNWQRVTQDVTEASGIFWKLDSLFYIFADDPNYFPSRSNNYTWRLDSDPANVYFTPSGDGDNAHIDYVAFEGGGTTDVIVEKNIFRTDEYGGQIIKMSGYTLDHILSNITIQNNLIYGEAPTSMLFLHRYCKDIKFYNNTVDAGDAHPSRAIRILTNDSDSSFYFYNNIFSGAIWENYAMPGIIKGSDYNIWGEAPPAEFNEGSHSLININLDSIFTDRNNFDFSPIMNEVACNGSINPVGVAVGALPCVPECVVASDCPDAECKTNKRCENDICIYDNTSDGTTCTNDSLFCTGAETCQSGSCSSSGNPCTISQLCTEPDICQDVDYPTDYISYWRFEGNADDENGVNNGVVYGNATINSSCGISGSGICLHGNISQAGTDEYVQVSNINYSTQEATFSWWMLAHNSSNPSGAAIIFPNPASKNPFIYSYPSTSRGFRIYILNKTGGATLDYSSPNGILALDTWGHFAVTYNSSGVFLYKNGTYIGGDTSFSRGTELANIGETTLYFGRHNGNDRYLNGSLDEIMFYSRALNESEIMQIYESQEPVIVPSVFIIYPQNITYASNITQINYTVTNGSNCWYSTNGGTTNSSAVAAGTNFTGLNLVSGALIVYCNSSDGTVGSDSVGFSVNSCITNLTNTSWSSWINLTCLSSDLMNQSRNRTEYDSNNCGEVSNVTYFEYRQSESCDYCVPSLINTTWSSWTNISCLSSDLMNQSRNRTEYDSNNCGEVSNVTYFEYRATEGCDYCTPSLTNTSWSAWVNISCTASDLMNQSRNRTQYDSNNCGEIGNVTYRQYRQSESCDYCTPALINTSWSSWTNITCLPGDLMNQSRYRIQYDSNNCGETANSTFYDYSATEYCHFLDHDGDNITDSLDCNDFNASINICRGCLICNDTISSNESRGECKPSTNVAAINRTEHGCPLPRYDKFSRNLTTNLSRINLTNAENVSVGISETGRLRFLANVNLYRNSSNVFYPLDLDSYINITDKKISMDSDNLPELNVSAELTFYNVTYSNPVVKKNGADFSDYSVLQLPNSSNDYAMVINVSSFTYYEIVDNSTEEEDSGDDTTTTSSGGGGGGGGSFGKRIILGAEWSSVELRVNEKVLFDYDNKSHHIFVDRINADSVDISVYSERVVLNLKEGRWAKVDLDGNSRNDIDVMYYGPNGSKAKIGVRLNSDIVAEKGITEEIITEETVQDTIEQEDNYEETQPEILEEPAPAKKSFILRYWIVLLSALLSLPILFIVVYAATGHMHLSLLKWKYFNYFSKDEIEKRRHGLSRKELRAIKSFVHKCLRWHYPKERIIKACVDVGWKKEVIEKVVEECGKGKLL